MSLFSGGRSHDKNPLSKSCQFYVEFLGWLECRGLRGHRYTDPVLNELRRRQQRPPKLTVEVSRKDVRITQEVEDKTKRGIKKVKFPTIPARDVTYVRQATRPEDGRPDDTVACIFLGFMPRTQRYVHVHVYRFDQALTATLFCKHMSALVENNSERIREVEIDLADKEEIDDPRGFASEGLSDGRNDYSGLRYSSSAGSDDESPTFGSDEIEPDLQSLKDVQFFDNVTDELKFRLKLADAPILLPPKDYDTIRRGHGNLEQINKRRCLNLNIVGEIAAFSERDESSEGGVDLRSHGSDAYYMSEEKQFPQTRSPPKRESVTIDPPQRLQVTPVKDPTTIPLEVSAKPDMSRQNSPFTGRLYPRDREGLKTEHHSGPRSPPITLSELVYPPKVTSLPASPVMYQQTRRAALGRQVSVNSMLTHLNNDWAGPPFRDYVRGSSDDLYAIPIRSSPRPTGLRQAELRPDYLQDFHQQPVLREMSQRNRQARFDRTLSDIPIRNDKVVSSRPNSADLQTRQLESQLYVSGSRHRGGEGIKSSLERISSGRRK